MMFRYKLIIYALAWIFSIASNAQSFGGISGFGSGMNAVQALKQAQQRADEAYANGRYELAFSRYQKLADVGDKFAQFRLAVMYEDGKHVQRNMAEAYAWSYVAAESGRKEFRDYHAQIRSRLNETELATARDLAAARIAEYGLYKQANKSYQLLTNTIRSCTGSRVGNRCDSVQVLDLTCSITSDELPGENCLRIGTMGLEAIVGNMPLQLRKVRDNLQNFMDKYNPGSVELGDFELVDDIGDNETIDEKDSTAKQGADSGDDDN